MLYRIRRFVVAGANVLLLYLTFRLFQGKLDWGQALGGVLLSAFWLGITCFSIRRLFAGYHDYISRLRVRVPLYLGVALAVMGIWSAGLHPQYSLVNEPGNFLLSISLLHAEPGNDPIIWGLGFAELAGWALLFRAYRRNSRRFIRTEWGFVHADTWLNPPVEAIPDLSAIITSGTIGPWLRDPSGKLRRGNPAGHLEVPYTDEKGDRHALSSWMNRGTVDHLLGELLDRKLAAGEHYFVREPNVSPSAKQLADSPVEARAMLAENMQWKQEAAERRAALISRLPLPAKTKTRLTEKFEPTGYYWMGLLNGQTKDNRGTCAGTGVGFWDRLGIPHLPLGKGLFGLGTGWVNPIKPSKIATDPNFRTLTLSVDKARWDARTKAPSA